MNDSFVYFSSPTVLNLWQLVKPSAIFHYSLVSTAQIGLHFMDLGRNTPPFTGYNWVYSGFNSSNRDSNSLFTGFTNISLPKAGQSK